MAEIENKDIKENEKKEVFLTIHGHFYQPPRENPWLEAIELQDSARPFHDWNERINKECYNPNSVSKVVDSRNRILDVVDNYEHMSFNFGPTLLSWMERFAPHTYERILKADIDSRAEHNGHGNAIAQVYNHMIMPLANEHDKETQVKWGITDFEARFGRKPEGIWLAETAVDDDTLRICEANGIKFTILSPYQALKIREEGSNNWQDVSWGNIDPARSYRYYIKSAPGKFIDLFFYDGAISQSVAFDELLKDGNRFIKRLKEGISDVRNYPQLVHIATDGESYGHHTKFGDMALAYVLRYRAEAEGFKITNYAEYLEKYRKTDYLIDSDKETFTDLIQNTVTSVVPVAGEFPVIDTTSSTEYGSRLTPQSVDAFSSMSEADYCKWWGVNLSAVTKQPSEVDTSLVRASGGIWNYGNLLSLVDNNFQQYPIMTPFRCTD